MAREAQTQRGRAFHAREGGARRQRDAVVLAVGQEHQFTRAIIRLDFGHGAEMVVGPQIAHPGQHAVDNEVVAVGPCLQPVLLDAGDALHGVGEPGAAHGLAGHKLQQRVLQRLGMGRALQVQGAGNLAPHQEAGGAADLRDLGNGLDGTGIAGTARQAGQLGTEGPGFTQLLHDLLRIQPPVDVIDDGSQRTLCDFPHGLQHLGIIGTVDFLGQR